MRTFNYFQSAVLVILGCLSIVDITVQTERNLLTLQ